jgi:hypothetical protein
MALSQQILDAVTEVDTKVGSVIELIQQLQANEVITPEAAAQILGAIQGTEDKLDAALAPPTP